mgnify:CR=1 FL=1
MKEIKIYGDYIKLDQFLKKENGIIIQEKRKKIRLGDELSLGGKVYKIIEAKK